MFSFRSTYDTPPPPETDDTAGNDRVQALIEHQAFALAEVNRISLRMLQALEHEAMEPAPTTGPDAPVLREEARPRIGELSRSMTSLAKSIRQTALMQLKIADDSIRHDLKLRAERERKARLDARLDQVVAGAATAARAAGVAERPQSERLYSEPQDWFADLDEAELMAGSVGELLARLCADHGLPFDPFLHEAEPWAIEEMNTRPAGSRYAIPAAPSISAPASPHRSLYVVDDHPLTRNICCPPHSRRLA